MKRRGLLLGLAGIVAAPAIVRAGGLMPVRVLPPEPLVWTAILDANIVAARAITCRRVSLDDPGGPLAGLTGDIWVNDGRLYRQADEELVLL
jgi:hypothetical protein